MQFSTTTDVQINQLAHAQRERLAFIDFSLQYFGHISRQELVQQFKTGLAAATRDFTLYRELAGNNLKLIHQTKSYHRQAGFTPLFEHDSAAVLRALSNGFGNGLSGGLLPSEQCFDAVNLSHPDAKIIAALMRAIHLQQAIRCQYVSVSSGAKYRELVPHALINNGHRWHVRAYDREHQAFRDFVATRFLTVEASVTLPVAAELADADEQFNQHIILQLIPHPSLPHTAAIELDYGMQDGQLKLVVKACTASYVLRHWQVDCSPGHKIIGQGCQLALANTDVLQEVENASLCPGYRKL